MNFCSASYCNLLPIPLYNLTLFKENENTDFFKEIAIKTRKTLEFSSNVLKGGLYVYL